ncbi:unnamed protein product [Polarella glacialis]|uniref:DUS-like FMN-binding domain-containing protein n=1 Tax=Polarella glacialis TaxID=89957 RepID=A0A813ETQ6_POLGL|nr:unnamed protein product [Polarella glacialis]
MMGYTDFCFRRLLRLISPKLVLWTEMVNAYELVYKAREGDLESVRRMLRLSDPSAEPPTVLQLGGSTPEILAEAVQLALPFGYSEINLNCGCPGSDAQKGTITEPCGAAMMKDASVVRECTTAMAKAAASSNVPVSIKCRIGTHNTVKDMQRDGDVYETLLDFVDSVASAGHVKRFHVHARSAVLADLGVEGNREVPPLRHDFVLRLRNDRPELELTLNGGIKSLAEAQSHLDHGLDVMVGRWAIDDP